MVKLEHDMNDENKRLRVASLKGGEMCSNTFCIQINKVHLEKIRL